MQYESTYLAHHGILGMKWGVRRYQNPDGTLTEKGKKRYSEVSKIGDDAYLLLRKNGKGMRTYDMRKDNKKIGMSLVDEYDAEHDQIDWIGVKDKYQGRGYGQAALAKIIDDSVKRGKKYITLDAAGMDPKAAHIYEKQGFKAVSEWQDDPFWDGLLPMRKDL